jgi:hypothetical protein
MFAAGRLGKPGPHEIAQAIGPGKIGRRTEGGVHIGVWEAAVRQHGAVGEKHCLGPALPEGNQQPGKFDLLAASRVVRLEKHIQAFTILGRLNRDSETFAFLIPLEVDIVISGNNANAAGVLDRQLQ